MTQVFTIDDLSVVWGRVLNRPSVGVNDNFFELGGTPALATQLFQEIGRLCGRELPSVMIYQAPTLGTLTQLLQHSAQPSYCPLLLPIKRGANPAIFLAHGMGGDATQLHSIAQHLKVGNSIYATQAPGIDGASEPLDSIEKMADAFISVMRKVQPCGPYILVGYSFGGLVMMEIARRLQSEGEATAFLAMLDTYPHRIHLQPRQHLPLFLRSIRRRVASIGRSFGTSSNEQVIKSPMDLARERVHDAESVAWRNYRPSFYGGKIYFLRAATPTYYPKNVRAVWGPYAQELEVHDVPGDHQSLVEGQHKIVAGLLTRQLRQILPCKCVA